MDTKALLEEFLSAGKEFIEQGKTYAEGKLDIPAEGPERDAALASAGKGATAAGVLALLLMTKTGRGVTGAGLKLGTLAALGNIAYKTYQEWSQKQNGTVESAAPLTSTEALTAPQANQKSLVLLKAIIAAAKSDGHIDDAEKSKIESMVAKLGLDIATSTMINEEVAKPLDPKAIADLSDSQATAAEIYLVSALVIDDANEQERTYLNQLASNLNIPTELALQFEQQVKNAS